MPPNQLPDDDQCLLVDEPIIHECKMFDMQRHDSSLVKLIQTAQLFLRI